MKPLHLGWHASVLLREPLIRTGMIVLRLGQQTLQGEIINQKIVANNSGVCRSAWFKLARHRRDFTSKALEVPGQLNFSVCHDFSKFLKPFQLYVALGSAGKCKIWKSPQKLLGGGGSAKKGKRQNMHQWKPTSNFWSEFILYMAAVQEPWHFSCQSSFTLTHSSSF